VTALLRRAGLPVAGAPLGVERYLELMSLDKKVSAGKLRLVLLRALGEGCITGDAPAEMVRAAIAKCCET